MKQPENKTEESVRAEEGGDDGREEEEELN